MERPGEILAGDVTKSARTVCITGARTSTDRVARWVKAQGHLPVCFRAGDWNAAELAARAPDSRVLIVCGKLGRRSRLLQLIRALRDEERAAPRWIVVLFPDEAGKLPFAAITAGADHVFPLGMALTPEFAALLERRLLDASSVHSEIVRAGPLALLPDEHRVEGPGLSIVLGQAQFLALRLITDWEPEVTPLGWLTSQMRERLARPVSRNSMHKTVSRLRKRLGRLEALVVTVRGRGYRFDPRGYVPGSRR